MLGDRMQTEEQNLQKIEEMRKTGFRSVSQVMNPKFRERNLIKIEKQTLKKIIEFNERRLPKMLDASTDANKDLRKVILSEDLGDSFNQTDLN